jgi:hypothetical protein
LDERIIAFKAKARTAIRSSAYGNNKKNLERILERDNHAFVPDLYTLVGWDNIVSYPFPNPKSGNRTRPLQQFFVPKMHKVWHHQLRIFQSLFAPLVAN